MMTVPSDIQEARAELVQLTQLLLPFAIRGLATLGVADVLADGPAPVGKIAEAVGADPDALYRTMRFTASHGVFAEGPEYTFGLTPRAEYLRGDVPGSMRGGLMMGAGTATQLAVFGEIVHTLRTGESGYHKLNGVSPFQAMASDRPMAKRVGGQLQRSSQRLSASVTEAVDFGADRVVADICGGTGTMIGTILARYPDLSGVLLDLPPVVEEASEVLADLGVAGRCRVVGGDMFTEVPAGADTYLLSCVLHDWADDQAVAILAQVRQAMPGTGRLLVVEAVIGAGGTPTALALQADFSMLVYGGGRERSRSEHAAVLERAGFTLVGITPTSSGFSVLQARPEPGGPE